MIKYLKLAIIIIIWPFRGIIYGLYQLIQYRRNKRMYSNISDLKEAVRQQNE
jgi:hypothetical protein